MGLYTVNLEGYDNTLEFGDIEDRHNELEDYIEILETRLKIENLRPRTIKDYMKWYIAYVKYCNGQQIFKLSKLDTLILFIIGYLV